jgi:hypothetical protein
MRRFTALAAAMIAATTLSTANAAFIVQPDVDGVAHTGTLTQAHIAFNPKLSWGNGTGPAGVGVSIPSAAVGLQPGNSIWSGNGVPVDQYIFTYNPSTDVDNATYTLGQNLGAGNLATGLTGGVSGLYRVYATWPVTNNVSSSPNNATNYVAESDLVDANISYFQNSGQGGLGGVWNLIGLVHLTADGTPYNVFQTAPNRAFVSMRAAGIMWELVEADPVTVPEPTTLALCALSIVGLVGVLRRR